MKWLVGMVVSDKMQKSVVMAMNCFFHNKLYNRYIKCTSKFMVHKQAKVLQHRRSGLQSSTTRKWIFSTNSVATLSHSSTDQWILPRNLKNVPKGATGGFCQHVSPKYEIVANEYDGGKYGERTNIGLGMIRPSLKRLSVGSSNCFLIFMKLGIKFGGFASGSIR